MNALQEKGENILKLIANMHRLRDEQECSLKQLEQSAGLMLQGIDPNEICKLKYDPILDKRRQHSLRENPPIINVVVLKNGDSVVLNPPLLWVDWSKKD